MPKKIIRNLQFGVGMSLLILIASSGASYWSIQKQMDNRESLSKTRRLIAAVKEVAITILDAETGNRGYQLTSQENFLEPYNRAVTELPKAIERAKSLEISDNNQQQRLKDLEQSIDDNINII